MGEATIRGKWQARHMRLDGSRIMWRRLASTMTARQLVPPFPANPACLQYTDPETGKVYYLHPETKETSWDK